MEPICPSQDIGGEKDIKFIGMDRVAERRRHVGEEGRADRHFPATPSAEDLGAIKHLNGEKVEKTVTLDTERVTSQNVDAVLKRHGM